MSESQSATMGFIRKSLIGGLVVLLPLAIIGFFFKWLYRTVTGFVQPLTDVFSHFFGLPGGVADLVAVVLLVLFCFMVGNLVTTRLGGWFWSSIEKVLIRRVPGYRTVREVVTQVLGSGESPFTRGEVARVWLFGRQVDVSATALVTSRHADGTVTVFVPTGPNPTSGLIYHVHPDCVELRPDIRIEHMMKSIIACGAGSGKLFQSGSGGR